MFKISNKFHMASKNKNNRLIFMKQKNNIFVNKKETAFRMADFIYIEE